MANRQLRDGRRGESAAQHALQSLPATLPGTEAGSDESSVLWQAHQVCVPRTADAKTWHQVRPTWKLWY